VTLARVKKGNEMDQAVKAAKKPAAVKEAAPGLVKFKTGGINGGIERVEVIRETEACVYVPTQGWSRTGKGERREAKRSDWTQYHDTWADAHAYLMGKAQSCVDSARRELEQANGRLGNVKGMKPPKADA
jgi:hypothetical protein